MLYIVTIGNVIYLYDKYWLNLPEEISSILPLFLACRRQSRIPMIKMMRMTTAAAADPAMIVVGMPPDGNVGYDAENRHMNTEWKVLEKHTNMNNQVYYYSKICIFE